MHVQALELFAYNNFPAKLCDKLSKDTFKSYQRKLRKYAFTGNRLLASHRIFMTSMYSSFFMYLAGLSVDVAVACASSLTDRLYNKTLTADQRSHLTLSRVIIWLSKKVVLTTVSLTAFSAGYAVGGYVGGPDYGTLVGSIALEALASSAAGLILF